MQILYITPELPYPLTSGFLRHYYFLRGLCERHDVTLFSPTQRPQISEESRKELGKFAKHVVIFSEGKINNALSGLYVTPVAVAIEREVLRRRAVTCMQSAVREFLRERSCDLVVFSGKNNLPVLQATGGTPVVIDCCDAAHVRHLWEAQHCGFPRSCWSYMRYLQARRVERAMMTRSKHVLFASARDQMAITGANDRGHVIPNGVDLQYWRGSDVNDEHTIVFSGVMSYRPNHDAALVLIREVLPIVRRSEPGASVCIVGRDPLPELRREANTRAGVIVTGAVADMRPYLASASVYVAPLRYASGIQNKLLEAMAMGIPVVTTEVAAAGLRTSTESLPVLLAEQASDIAEKTTSVMRWREVRRTLGAQGRRYVEKHFDWPTILRRLEAVCMEAACQREAVAVENS